MLRPPPARGRTGCETTRGKEEVRREEEEEEEEGATSATSATSARRLESRY